MLRIILFNLFLFGVGAKDWEANCAGDELEGVCVEPRYCFSTNPYIYGLVYPKPCTTAEGNVGVCCTDCELVYNANDALLDKNAKESGVLWKTGQKSWDKCIEYVQKYTYISCNIHSGVTRKTSEQGCHYYRNYTLVSYAVGGKDVSPGEFPHMALLGYRDTSAPSEWVCSGALISDRFILTAAHCISSREFGPVTEAAFGVLKRSDPAEQWRRYKIKRVIPHPDYSPPSKYHDIALLETEIPVTFINKTVLPACLPAYDEFIPYKSTQHDILATGWGSLGYMKGLADTMQKVSLSKFSAEECDSQFPVHRHLRSGLNHDAQMCFGHKKEVRDTCKGDSGGPLQLDSGRPTCVSTVVGVTSYGAECGFLGQAGVYTRVAAYLPWIEDIVWP